MVTSGAHQALMGFLELSAAEDRREVTGEMDLSYKSVGMPGMPYESNLSV